MIAIQQNEEYILLADAASTHLNVSVDAERDLIEHLRQRTRPSLSMADIVYKLKPGEALVKCRDSLQPPPDDARVPSHEFGRGYGPAALKLQRFDREDAVAGANRQPAVGQRDLSRR